MAGSRVLLGLGTVVGFALPLSVPSSAATHSVTTSAVGLVSSSAAPQDVSLGGVDAISASNVWTVGYTVSTNQVVRTLIEHWDGTSWSRVASPSPGDGLARFSTLAAVTAVSASDVWAVGTVQDANGTSSATLIEHWNGTRWTRVASPNPSHIYIGLDSVTATSATDAWAVGRYVANSTTTRTLIEHWNGSTWTVAASPSPGKHIGLGLVGTSSTSPDEAWAVGYYEPTMRSKTLVEHWDGGRWTQLASPNPYGGSFDDSLNGVSAHSGSDAWAVGDASKTGTGRESAFTLHWDGSTWSTVPSFHPATGEVYLSAVTVDSATDAWAVGYLYAHHNTTTFIEHWDGTSWAQAPSPTPPSHPGLYGVTALDRDNAWTVGSYGDRTEKPLALQWDGLTWTRTLPNS